MSHKPYRWMKWITVSAGNLVIFTAAWLSMSSATFAQDEPDLVFPVLPRVAISPAKPATTSQTRLGERLFFDTKLSKDGTVSCSTCHNPRQGWSDGLPTSKGIEGKRGTRNAPTLLDVTTLPLLFWDGRARSLEDQIREPIENPIEMGMPLAKLVELLRADEAYAAEFESAYGAPASEENVVAAIAAFVRTIRHGTTPFDRYRAGDRDALSPAAKRGHDVFFFRANCSTCHRAPLFTDHEFHNLGVGIDPENVEATTDLGRFTVSDFPMDRRAFKTPTLRDVSRSGPYMHDGRFKTLKDVVEFYAEGGVMNPQLDPLMNVIPLSESEQADLVQFLKEGLTSDKPLDSVLSKAAGAKAHSESTSQTTRKPK